MKDTQNSIMGTRDQD